MKTPFSLFVFLVAGVSVLAQPQPPARELRPDRKRPGPWDNDVLVYRVATGAEPEKLATFERAGVPTAARLKDGRLLAAFQNFPQDDSRNFDRVAVRFSSDEGRTWSKAEPVVVLGMEAGLARPFDPTLVPLPDGRVRLYFTSNRSPDFRRSTPQIYSAVSTNGVRYTFEPGVRFGIEGRIVIDCAAALHEGVFHLIVPDNGGAGDFMARPQRGQQPMGGTGYHAVSRDGLKFERVADVKLASSRDRWLGNMQSDEDRLVFFGTGPGPWPVISRDGVTWETAPAATRVPGADPGAVKLRDGSWLLLGTGPPRPGTPSATAAPRQNAAVPREPDPEHPADPESAPAPARPRPRTDINRPLPGTEAPVEAYAKVNPDSDFIPRRGGVAAPGGPAPMRLMLATSPDGLKFERRNRIVTDQGSVPDLVVDTNGWIWLYFQAASVGDDVNRVALALSKDQGASWTFRRVTLHGFSSPRPDPCDPEIQLLDDGTFRLFLTWSERGQRPVSWLTESRDGVSFKLVGQAFDPGGTALDPSILRLGDTWHIFAGGGRGPGENWHGTSRDGRIFAADRPVRFTANGVDCMMANGLPLSGGGGRFYAFNNPRPGQPHRIYSFSALEGAEWRADPGIRLDADGLAALEAPGFGVQDPAIGRLQDGTWLMIYTTRIPGTRPPRLRPDVTSEDIAALARRPEPAGMSSAVATPRPGAAVPGNASPRRSAETPLGAEESERPAPGARRFEGVFIRIPSRAAGEEGVAASVLIPRQSRFTNGAPVVINVAGGVQAGNARGQPEYVGHGFLEIHFAFPGGGVGDERSGGTYDFRGSNCVRALADVIRFATGRIADTQGRFVGELARGVMVLTNNVGLIGSSHGGNACGLAMAKHGGEYPNLGWYASMESPYGEGAANVELGGHESGVNPAYDPKTGALDLSRLAWSPDLTPGLFRKPMLIETRAMKGALFFDLNGDGRFSRDDDFPANCFVGDAGGGAKAWYSPRVLAEAEKRSLMPGGRPAHMPMLAEAGEFWSWRDAAPSIPAAVRRCKNLAVIVYANERDHVQADPAHTHILEQVEGFRKAGARFVRLNPDCAYVERLAPAGPRFERERSFPDNPAGKAWTRANITEGLEPSVLPLGLYMQAAVCELADRTQAGDWSVNLDAVLFPEAPRSASPPPRGRAPGAGPRPFNP